MTNSAALFQMPNDRRGGSEIEDAATAAFADLEAQGLLGPIETVKRAAILKAASSLDNGLKEGRVSVATSNILKQVIDTLDSLPRAASGDTGMDALTKTLERLTDFALVEGLAS